MTVFHGYLTRLYEILVEAEYDSHLSELDRDMLADLRIQVIDLKTADDTGVLGK